MSVVNPEEPHGLMRGILWCGGRACCVSIVHLGTLLYAGTYPFMSAMIDPARPHELHGPMGADCWVAASLCGATSAP